MEEIKFKTICPLPWMHFSSHLDSTMRICCNTDGSGFVIGDDGENIKLDEVKDINSYFNLNYYKNIRLKMLGGEKPKECSKCYEVESFNGKSIRECYLDEYKNNQSWLESVDKTNAQTGEIEPKVQSLDLSLSNNCNLKCIMCSPASSFPIKKDFDIIGLDYSPEFVEGARKNWIDNKGIDVLIPSIAGDLRSFLTTGGEPFLSKEHYRILEIIVKSGNAGNVGLQYHTNCTINNEKLFEIWNHFKSVSIHFSIDAFGELNEYIRFKTKWEDVVKNVNLMIAHPKTSCEIHTTVQVLNIFHLDKLYNWANTLKGIPPLPYHIWMDQPEWLKINILPLELKQEALLKLDRFFAAKDYQTGLSIERSNQIQSYLLRSIEGGSNENELANFRKLIRQFEQIRKNPRIESLVPELKILF